MSSLATRKGNPLLPLMVGGLIVVVFALIWFMRSGNQTDLETGPVIDEASFDQEIPDRDSTDQAVTALTTQNDQIVIESRETADQVEQLTTELDVQKKKFEESIAILSRDHQEETAKLTTDLLKAIERLGNDFDSYKTLTANELARMEAATDKKISSTNSANRGSGAVPVSFPELPTSPVYLPGQKLSGKEQAGIVYITSIDDARALPVGDGGGGFIEDGVSAISSFASSSFSLDAEGEIQSASNPNVRQRRAATGWLRSAGPEGGDEKEAVDEPYFTLPDLSIGLDGTAITAMLGRIYHDDNIQNPMPVKVKVGRESMAANYTNLPAALDGMILGGYAYGDRSFGCVAVNLTAATFVFEDGTISTTYIDSPGARPGNDAYRSDTIGYISDKQGHPCIPGEYVTDAPRNLGLMAGVSAMAGFADAFRQKEVDTSVFSGGAGNSPIVVEQLTGSATRFAAATGAASGLDATAEWIRDNYGKIYEGYYAPAGQAVVVHLERELRIDKTVDARRTTYGDSVSDGGGFD